MVLLQDPGVTLEIKWGPNKPHQYKKNIFIGHNLPIKKIYLRYWAKMKLSRACVCARYQMECALKGYMHSTVHTYAVNA